LNVLYEVDYYRQLEPAHTPIQEQYKTRAATKKRKKAKNNLKKEKQSTKPNQ